MIINTHHYFLLAHRPWPVILRLRSFNLILSFLFFFKFGNLVCFLGCLVTTYLFSFSWWVGFRAEFNLEGKNSTSLERGVKIGIILFISSEVFFFFSFFWSYFHYFLSPPIELGLRWPPILLESFDFLGVPLINTLILIGSGLTVTIRHYYLMEGKKSISNFWLFTTLTLGMLFSYFQLMEYKRSFFSIRDGTFGCAFFVLTGFHGIHVLIGSIFLLATLIRSCYLNSSVRSFLRFELASWYWHFVDVVWIFLYCFLYYIVD